MDLDLGQFYLSMCLVKNYNLYLFISQLCYLEFQLDSTFCKTRGLHHGRSNSFKTYTKVTL